MAIATWAVKVNSKNTLNKLIAMVQSQELEEIFLCEVTDDEAISEDFSSGDIIAIVANKKEKSVAKFTKLGASVILDDLDDEKFDIDEDGASLKGVRYPENEDDELGMLAKLV